MEAPERAPPPRGASPSYGDCGGRTGGNRGEVSPACPARARRSYTPSKVPHFDGHNTSCCSDKGVALAGGGLGGLQRTD